MTENFLLEENSVIDLTFKFCAVENLFVNAIEVIFVELWADKIFAKMFSIFSDFLFDKFINSVTFIVPSVIVPVLSRQRTSVLASISIEYMSLTNVFLFASLTTPTDKAMVISKNIPAGIIPVIAPLVFETTVETSLLLNHSFIIVPIPRGIRIIPIYFISLFKSLKRFDEGALNSFAFAATVWI